MKFSIYRYNPEVDKKPYIQKYILAETEIESGMMLLDALLKLKQHDETLGFRRSCREGVCGSDAMNINGVNGLACITRLFDLKQPIELRPLPGMPVVRDLIVDMDLFFEHYKQVKPWLITNDFTPEKEHTQMPNQREKLDGLYECILCGACTASCPSWWWNPKRFLGPAALLQAARFVNDSRDQATHKRLEQVNDTYKLYRCHTIMNCIQVCPKKLNPTKAIGILKREILKQKI